MKDDYVTREESNLSLKSIAESGRITTECLQTLTKSIQEIKEYIIHNDYRHTANETEIRDIKRKSEKKIHSIELDISTILKIMDERKPLWSAFKKSKVVVGIIATGALATAGGALYNYMAKSTPAINQNKELTVKPAIKVIK